MTAKILILISICFLVYTKGYGQFSDNFADGDLSSNPVWTGNTADWTVNNALQLQSNNNLTNSTFYVSTASAMATTAQWVFYCQMAFNPSSANYVDVYLTASAGDLTASSTTGYFVRIGNTDDEISLYRKEAGAVVKIIDGINGIQLIRKEYEEVKIIVLTMYDDQQMISKMMEMGANAYLTKTTDPEEIYNAILTCMNDDFYFNDLVNQAVMGKLMQKKNIRQHYGNNASVTFNEKELKILQLLAEDKTTEEISKVIFLSPRTVETIRQNMKTKVNAKTIGGLIMYGMRHKLIE